MNLLLCQCSKTVELPASLGDFALNKSSSLGILYFPSWLALHWVNWWGHQYSGVHKGLIKTDVIQILYSNAFSYVAFTIHVNSYPAV